MGTYSRVIGNNNRGLEIGYIERWLILLLAIMQRYNPIGLLMAVKLDIRFGDSQTWKFERFCYCA